jgi:N utilization substance protein B
VAARSKARKRALDVLYEADVRSVDPLGTLAERVALAEPPVNDYTIELVEGVQANRVRIDEILAEYAEGWTVARMPDVDRAVLRLGVYELLWRDEVPDAVAIDEAVELAKTLSTDESPRYVNGILARVVRQEPKARANAGTEERQAD